MQNFKNRPAAEISKSMIILSDENLKSMFLTWPYQIIASPHDKNTQQNEETCIGYSQISSVNDSSMSGTWNTKL